MIKGQMILIYSDNAIFITIAEKNTFNALLKATNYILINWAHNYNSAKVYKSRIWDLYIDFNCKVI